MIVKEKRVVKYSNGRKASMVKNGSSKYVKAEKNDCSVIAISNALNVSYDDAHEFCRKSFNRKRGKGARGVVEFFKANPEVKIKTNKAQLSLFEEDNNKEFQIKYLGSCPKMGGDLVNTRYKHKPVAYTVKTFLQKYIKGTYMLLVKGHMFCIKNGVLLDNKEYDFDGLRRPIESAFKVEELIMN
jgi:hypothetical protein